MFAEVDEAAEPGMLRLGPVVFAVRLMEMGGRTGLSGTGRRFSLPSAMPGTSSRWSPQARPTRAAWLPVI